MSIPNSVTIPFPILLLATIILFSKSVSVFVFTHSILQTKSVNCLFKSGLNLQKIRKPVQSLILCGLRAKFNLCVDLVYLFLCRLESVRNGENRRKGVEGIWLSYKLNLVWKNTLDSYLQTGSLHSKVCNWHILSENADSHVLLFVSFRPKQDNFWFFCNNATTFHPHIKSMPSSSLKKLTLYL